MIALLLLLLAASPLDTAREHLKAGRFDDVLFALDGKTFEGEDKARAASLLGEAAQGAMAKGDDFLALQFAQMALKLNPEEGRALEAAARAAMKQQQFDAAERYADKWILTDVKNGSARLLRAQLAAEAGEWAVVVDHLDQAKLKGADVAAGKALRARAAKELDEKTSALSTVAALERQMAEAASKARANGGAGFARPARTEGVVIYTTTWCGYCKKAKAYLKKKGVDFVEKDIEKDQDAAQELAQKAAAANVMPQGVPVIDVHGKLILGFDEAAIAAAL
jgi:glutaredoxin-like YruB-family protein